MKDAIIIRKNFKFRGENLKIVQSNYVQGGNPAWVLFTDTDEPYTTATINLPGLALDELAIKTYSENEGLLEALMSADIIELPHRWVASGFVSIPIVRVRQ